jgi:hypothetical protein
MSADEFLERYGDGYEVGDSEIVSLDVEYERGNPENNRAVAHREGVADIILSRIVIALVSLWPVVSGCRTCRESIETLVAARARAGTSR